MAALRDAAASAKERIEGGLGALLSRVDPQVQSPKEPARDFDLDSAPTITVDLPEGMSFNDFDPGEPQTPVAEAESARDAAPAVAFDPDGDGALDGDGIPVWEGPPQT